MLVHAIGKQQAIFRICRQPLMQISGAAWIVLARNIGGGKMKLEHVLGVPTLEMPFRIWVCTIERGVPIVMHQSVLPV